LVEIWPDFVVFVSFSVVFAEIYGRIMVRRVLRRVLGGLAAFAAGEDTGDSRLVRNAATVTLAAARAVVVKQDEDGKWHLTKLARSQAAIGLQVIGEIASKIRVQPGAGGVLGGLGANLDLNQLAQLGISQLPKKQQATASIVYSFVQPLIEPLAAWAKGAIEGFKAKGGGAPPAGPRSTTGGGGGENPFLKDLKP
jgi:hypothetical protein